MRRGVRGDRWTPSWCRWRSAPCDRAASGRTQA